jgi:DNA-binding GntR family transcriptional regulator
MRRSALEPILNEHLSLSDRIYNTIEKVILSGSLKPGERLVETRLSKDLGVSKSPVREALRRLAGEGTIILKPRRGYFVRDIDRKSIDDFFDIMFILEPTSAALSLKGKNESVCGEIEEILENMDRCLRENNYETYRELNDQFHALFANLTGNEWIIKIRMMLQKQAFMLRSLSLTVERFPNSLKEHRAIADAYIAGNEKLLIKAVKYHVSMFKENILQADFLKKDVK